jgi:hypothetical protein
MLFLGRGCFVLFEFDFENISQIGKKITETSTDVFLTTSANITEHESHKKKIGNKHSFPQHLLSKAMS